MSDSGGGTRLVGRIVGGCQMIGILSAVGGIVCAVIKEWSASAAFFIAAALAFGLLCNAVLRD